VVPFISDTRQDDFYHVPKIVNACKKYTAAVVRRYKHSPALFAWELANEPRCGADGTKNLPRSAGTNCSYIAMDKWMADMGNLIKSIDPDHMVTWGGEGESYEPDNEDWAYAGSDGGNIYNELSLKERKWTLELSTLILTGGRKHQNGPVCGSKTTASHSSKLTSLFFLKNTDGFTVMVGLLGSMKLYL
jgi:endo-1,4-beta-mannosidase